MTTRDRIVDFRRVRASSLRAHPRNWRTHPPQQRAALEGVLREIGYAGALLARELPDGSLELIDGHLRAETTPDEDVPVLVVDLTDDEAALLLSVHDPLAAMAGRDDAILAGLVASLKAEDEAVRRLIDELSAESWAASPDAPPREVAIPHSHEVVVRCRDEIEQRAIYEELTARGHKCRVLTI